MESFASNFSIKLETLEPHDDRIKKQNKTLTLSQSFSYYDKIDTTYCMILFVE